MEVAKWVIEKHKKLADHVPGNEERKKFIEQINTFKKMVEWEYPNPFKPWLQRLFGPS
ncbi:hypothetical protein [Peribacillus muralis]|uniref:hypothetical protein n=1 Tax=Peribacillus muralis TaxID=264697 RepID=UPI003D08610B